MDDNVFAAVIDSVLEMNSIEFEKYALQTSCSVIIKKQKI